jgi:hypothetical protein
LSIVLLVGVGLHVSRELTILEDETRTLAEELAILRNAVERLESSRQENVPCEQTGNVNDYQAKGLKTPKR